jgi:hypothetical protein
MLRRPRLRAGHGRADPGYASARPAAADDTPVSNDDHHQARHGFVPSGFKARESKDGRAHACIIRVGFGQARLMCLWLPPNI